MAWHELFRTITKPRIADSAFEKLAIVHCDQEQFNLNGEPHVILLQSNEKHNEQQSLRLMMVDHNASKVFTCLAAEVQELLPDKSEWSLATENTGIIKLTEDLKETLSAAIREQSPALKDEVRPWIELQETDQRCPTVVAHSCRVIYSRGVSEPVIKSDGKLSRDWVRVGTYEPINYEFLALQRESTAWVVDYWSRDINRSPEYSPYKHELLRKIEWQDIIKRTELSKYVQEHLA